MDFAWNVDPKAVVKACRCPTPPIYLYDYLDLSNDIWHRLSAHVKSNFFMKICHVCPTVGAREHRPIKIEVTFLRFWA